MRPEEPMTAERQQQQQQQLAEQQQQEAFMKLQVNACLRLPNQQRTLNKLPTLFYLKF